MEVPVPEKCDDQLQVIEQAREKSAEDCHAHIPQSNYAENEAAETANRFESIALAMRKQKDAFCDIVKDLLNFN